MERLTHNDRDDLMEPVDADDDTLARGDWEDQLAGEAADDRDGWEADAERRDYRVSLGAQGIR